MSEDSPRSDRVPPWEKESQRDGMSFGLWLRRQRETREVPLREVADVTKISLRYLEALEQDRFDVLPAPVFARGFLREYARYVGLDADEVVNSFLTATGEVVVGEDDAAAEPVGSRGHRSTIFAVAAVIIILSVVGVVAWLGRSQAGQPAQTPPIAPPMPVRSQPVEQEAVTPGAAEQPALTPEAGVAAGSGTQTDHLLLEPASLQAPLTVILDFTEDCWVEANVDDERTTSELRVQGESMRLEATERVFLTLGNPAGVRVEVNGMPYEFEFTKSRIVRDLEIDLALAGSLENGAG